MTIPCQDGGRFPECSSMKTLSSFKILSTKKARNFLARDGPGSFDQPNKDILNYKPNVNRLNE